MPNPPDTRSLSEVPPTERLEIARRIAAKRLPADLRDEGVAEILLSAELLLRRRPDAPLGVWLVAARHTPTHVTRTARARGMGGAPQAIRADDIGADHPEDADERKASARCAKAGPPPKLLTLGTGTGDDDEGVVVADPGAVVPGSAAHLETVHLVDAAAIRVAAQAVEAWARHLSGPRAGDRVADAVAIFVALTSAVAAGAEADEACQAIPPHRSLRARKLLADALAAAASGAAPPEDLSSEATDALDRVRADLVGD